MSNWWKLRITEVGVESSNITCRGLGQSLYKTRSGSFSNLYRREVASHSKAQSRPYRDNIGSKIWYVPDIQ
jgi:hypothetical protein